MTDDTLTIAARRVLYDADLEDCYDMKDSDGRFISKKALIGLRDALAAGRETLAAPPSEPPTDVTGQNRLLLNAYGRQCYDLGYAAGRSSASAPAGRDTAPPEIACPACGEIVRQVSSATLALALWQHYHWTCKKAAGRETPAPPSEPQYPIPLNAQQLEAIKSWAADDRLWTTRETVEFNLRTFARVILKI